MKGFADGSRPVRLRRGLVDVSFENYIQNCHLPIYGYESGEQLLKDEAEEKIEVSIK
jgi:hypothetical protein